MEEKKISFKRQARILAFQAIYMNSINPTNLEELLLFNWALSIPPHVYKFAKELVLKTIENEDNIVKILVDNMKNPSYEEISEIEKSILKISICQFLYFKKISHSIVIDEAIELSKSYGSKNSYKMIHAILDKINKILLNTLE